MAVTTKKLKVCDTCHKLYLKLDVIMFLQCFVYPGDKVYQFGSENAIKSGIVSDKGVKIVVKMHNIRS